jgi:hypothetical protein
MRGKEEQEQEGGKGGDQCWNETMSTITIITTTTSSSSYPPSIFVSYEEYSHDIRHAAQQYLPIKSYLESQGYSTVVIISYRRYYK